VGCESGALATTPVPVTELAQWLSSLRRRSGLSYRQMAEQATTDPRRPFSHLRFHHADKGRKLASWEVVRTYVRVCDGDERLAERKWRKAEAATARPDRAAAAGRPGRRPVRAPEFIRDPLELLDAMREMRFRHGNRSLRALAEEAGVGRLPRSSLGVVLAGQRMPSKRLLLVFVEVCGGVRPGSARARAWEGAWERADATRRGVTPVPVVLPEEPRAVDAGAPRPAWGRQAVRMLRGLLPVGRSGRG
jgi:hypothetical protein